MGDAYSGGPIAFPQKEPRLVVIESPFAGNVERNVQYARAALLDSLNRGEYPIASHLLYPQVLNDLIPEQRTQGIEAGLAWAAVAEAAVFYVDLGWSGGMNGAYRRHSDNGKPIFIRKLGGEWSTE